MKQWISRILAAAMVVSLLSVSAFAAEHTEFPDYFSLDFEATQVDERLSVNRLGGSLSEHQSGHDFYYAVLFREGVETPRAFTSPIWMDDH